MDTDAELSHSCWLCLFLLCHRMEISFPWAVRTGAGSQGQQVRMQESKAAMFAAAAALCPQVLPVRCRAPDTQVENAIQLQLAPVWLCTISNFKLQCHTSYGITYVDWSCSALVNQSRYFLGWEKGYSCHAQSLLKSHGKSCLNSQKGKPAVRNSHIVFITISALLLPVETLWPFRWNGQLRFWWLIPDCYNGGLWRPLDNLKGRFTPAISIGMEGNFGG